MPQLKHYIFLQVIMILTLYSIAQESPTQHKKSQSLYASVTYYNAMHNYDSAMYFGDEYINHMLKYGNDSSRLNAYTHKINSLKQFNKLSEGLRLSLITFDKYCANKIDKTNCKSCTPINQHLAEFMITLKDYRKGINYLNIDCNPNKPALNFYIKARIYSLMGMPDSAQAQTQKSIKIALSQNRPKKIINTYNQHGIIARKNERFTEAIKAFSNAIKMVDSLGVDSSEYSYLTGNIGTCYYQMGDLDNAYKYLVIDADRSWKRDAKSFLTAELILAKIDLKRRDYIQTLQRLDIMISHYKHHLLPSQQLEILEMYTFCHQYLGNKSKYETYLHQWIKLTKSEYTRRIEINQKLIEGYTDAELEQVALQIEIEKELLNQNLIIQEQKSSFHKKILAGSAIILILIVLFFLSRYRKKALLKETQLKLANKEQELLKLKVKEEGRNVQILSYELLVKKDFSTNLIKQLEQFKNLSKQELRSIEFYIQNELDVKSTRAQLQNQMGELSGGFYNSLKIKHPNLTELELKLAGMVLMKMSNKEIAISKNTTIESSKKAKNRLKKKLGITPENELNSYLNGFV